MASAISSPTPQVVAANGSRFSAGTSGSPAAAAISSTAVPLARRMPYTASTLSPRGPVTVQTRRSSGAQRAATVPSPPSASGSRVMAAFGQAAKTPSRTASPASRDPRHPLKESIAMSTFIDKPSPLFSLSDSKNSPVNGEFSCRWAVVFTA